MGIDGWEFRQTLGRFATGVTVVSIDDGHAVHGMTANAFTSVSLDPPLVLVCIDKKNQTHALLHRFDRFAINVLAEDQEAISNYYAGRLEQGAAGRFHRPGTVAPILEGCLAWLDCTLERAYDGGDHTIFLARVEQLGRRDGRPLLYFCGRYERLAEGGAASTPSAGGAAVGEGKGGRGGQ
ncbi:MAG TPA: flavin reductase family protein [Limnochordia bacterium]